MDKAGFVEDFVVGRVGCAQDLRLSATLHQVFVCVVIEVEITLVADQLAFFLRQHLRLSLGAGDALVKLLEAHLGVLHKVVHRFE